MFAIQSNILWFFFFIHVSKCQRRIQSGEKVEGEKPYVVYLVKASMSKIRYDYWLCGGALVTTELVVTAAACIKDVDYLYVIAGYNKYVTDQDIELDPCTREKKKKVIFTCYPEGYNLMYDRLDKWSYIDIGVAKVESPYDFTDQSYKTICSYIPATIPINTEEKYQRAGLDAIVLGWGHKVIWRKPDDKKNYNQKSMKYAPVMILDKAACMNDYQKYGRMRDVIGKYMICTLMDGGMDEFGVPLRKEPGLLPYGCFRRKSLVNNTEADLEDCEYDDKDGSRRRIKKSSNVSMIEITKKKNYVNETTVETNITSASKRKDSTKSIASLNKRTHSTKRFTITDRTPTPNRTYLTNGTRSPQKTFLYNKTHNFDKTVRNSRRNGICQNDHGGPLVTWVGSHEILIGVASVFKVTEDYHCDGPYLYTSTQCNGAFLDCILAKTDFNKLNLNEDYDSRRSFYNVTDNNSRRSFCRKSSNDKTHITTERYISWRNHPAGPADHERHLIQGKNKPGAEEQVPERNEEYIYKNGKSINQENDRYSPIQISSVNINNAPNKKYILNKNIAPIVNQHGAPNYKYVANNPYPPNDRPAIINNKNLPYNGPAPDNRPASNNGAAPNNGAASNYGAAPNDGAVSDNGPPQANGAALNSGPAINSKSRPNNDHILRKGPELDSKYEQINNYASNNGPTLQDKNPASVISLKQIFMYTASNKPKMRPTLPFRT